MSDVLVVKLGGSNLSPDGGSLEALAAAARSRPVVVVHGGGARLTAWQERLGLTATFEDGLRVTDPATLEVALAVLRGLVNGELVATLRRAGVDAVGLSGIDGGLLVAERLPGLGLVASVVDIRREMLEAMLVAGQVPVVAPLALDGGGTICNVNADDAAAGIARGLGARQLVLLSDVAGVRGPDGTTLASLEARDVERLIAAGTVSGGMVPKVRAAWRAVADNPGAEAIIADGATPGTLDRAVSDPTFGTRVRGPRETAPGPADGPLPADGRRPADRSRPADPPSRPRWARAH